MDWFAPSKYARRQTSRRLMTFKIITGCPLNIYIIHRPPNKYFGVEITGCERLCGAITVELEMSEKHMTYKFNI